MSDIFLPFALVLFASFFQGTFGLGMKYTKPLSWEAWWLVYSVVAMIAFPVVWAALAVPDLWTSIASAPLEAVLRGMYFGFLWGIGGILFGVSVNQVGVSITYGVVMGLAAAVGSLLPLMQIPNASSHPALVYILAGVCLLLVGVAVSAYAGVQRDRVQQEHEKAEGGLKSGRAFRVGLGVAVVSGVLSALLNVGFADAAPVADAAVNQGAIIRNASLAAWVVVLLGAFIMNAGYAVARLVKHRSWGTFQASRSGKAYGWAVATGLFWFAALGVYGQGAALMGALGPVVGWPMLLGLALIISNVWAVRAGEWKGAPQALRLMTAGVAILVTACIVLGYSNGVR